MNRAPTLGTPFSQHERQRHSNIGHIAITCPFKETLHHSKLHIVDNDIEFHQLAIIMSNVEKGMCLETQGSQMTLNPETFKAKVTSQSPLTLRGVGREQVEPILP